MQLFPARTSVAAQEMVDDPPIETREGEAEMVTCGFSTNPAVDAVADLEVFEQVI